LNAKERTGPTAAVAPWSGSGRQAPRSFAQWGLEGPPGLSRQAQRGLDLQKTGRQRTPARPSRFAQRTWPV